jgi:hypothetical protein
LLLMPRLQSQGACASSPPSHAADAQSEADHERGSRMGRGHHRLLPKTRHGLGYAHLPRHGPEAWWRQPFVERCARRSNRCDGGAPFT